MADKAFVSTPSSAVNQMSKRRELPDALLSGTAGMRLGAAKWLPRETGEKVAAYNTRLDRSFLFEAYADALGSIAARPFSRPVKLGEGMNEALVALAPNIDLQGGSLTQFAGRLLEDGIHAGVTHVLVDYPPTEEGLTRAGESGLRPWFVHVPAESILGWRSETVNGVEILTQLRIRSVTCEPVGDFGEVEVERIAVWRRTLAEVDEQGTETEGSTTVEVWRRDPDQKDEENAWFVESPATAITLDEIPLRTFYANRADFMVGHPALEALAWKNLEHWQSSSDQRHILRFARRPVLFGSGFGKRSKDKIVTRTASDPGSEIDTETAMSKARPRQGIEIGASRTLLVENENAKLGWVEAQGHAIGAGREDLREIEEKMLLLGMRPLLQKPGDITATQSAIEESTQQADLKAWIRDLETFVSSLFELAAEWLGIEDASIEVDVNDDFQIGFAGSSDVETLLKLWAAHGLSGETLLSEYKRRGMLAPATDVGSELARLQTEGVAIGDE